MTSVNITTTKNTVTVNGETSVVTVATTGLAVLKLDLDETAKVDGSVVYYDQSSAKFKADATTTKLTLVDGATLKMANTVRIKDLLDHQHLQVLQMLS